MTHKRIAEALLSACFLLALLGTAAATILQPWESYSYFENRSLASRPAFTWESFWDGSYFSGLEAMLQDHAAGREELLRASTLADLYLFRRPVVNQVVPAGDKLLYYLDYGIVDAQAVAEQAQTLAGVQARLQELVESYGGHALYVAVPGQYAYFEDVHPAFLNNLAAYTDVEMASFTQAMARQAVSFLDVGPEFDAMGHPEFFYSSTDHHYTYAGAYQAYRIIMDRLNRDFGLDLTVLTEDLVTFETLPNPYLGSRLRMVFGLWPSSEHPQIARFNVPVPFTRRDNGQEVAPTLFALPASDQEDVLYSIYMGGDIGETVIDTGRPELPSLLIYGDSYTNALETLLWYSFDETRSIDLRHYREQSLADYIREYQPDVVLCVRDYGSLLSGDDNGDPFGAFD